MYTFYQELQFFLALLIIPHVYADTLLSLSFCSVFLYFLILFKNNSGMRCLSGEVSKTG